MHVSAQSQGHVLQCRPQLTGDGTQPWFCDQSADQLVLLCSKLEGYSAFNSNKALKLGLCLSLEV